MTRVLRNIALQTVVPLLCGLIVLNAYLVWRNIKLMEANSAQRAEVSETQAHISAAGFALQEMETSQRGYLVTGDASYLTPYHDANGRLALHLASLHSRLTGKDLSLEAQLESVAQSKIAEMNETIRIRGQGYRHRAFLIVGSNRGQELMDEARRTLDALSAAQTSNVARYEREMKARVSRATQESTFASLILLVVTVVTFLAFNGYRKRLEVGYARQAEEFRATSVQLEQLTSTVFHHFRALVGQMQNHANTLLDFYGGFLPRQGQEKAERIADGAGQMISLLDDLSKNSSPGSPAKVVEVPLVETLSA